MDTKIKDLCKAESDGFVLVRDATRQKELGEVFTPTKLVLEILNKVDKWEDGLTYLDPTCGNGQFLASVAIIKRELNHSSVLSSIYGVDLMLDNIADCRSRLLAIAGDTPENRDILDINLVCADARTYDYSFGESLFDWS